MKTLKALNVKGVENVERYGNVTQKEEGAAFAGTQHFSSRERPADTYGTDP